MGRALANNAGVGLNENENVQWCPVLVVFEASLGPTPVSTVLSKFYCPPPALLRELGVAHALAVKLQMCHVSEENGE